MQLNFDSAAVAGPMMTLGARAKHERAEAGQPRLVPGVRIPLTRVDPLENAVWAVLGCVALGALAASFVF